MILSLDFSSDVPIYMQVRNQIVVAISEGELKPGDKLPTIRNLAAESGINNMTVNKAYALLKQEKFITTDRRSGAIVNQFGNNSMSDRLMRELRLVISEAKLCGVSEDEILEICHKLFNNIEEISK